MEDELLMLVNVNESIVGIFTDYQNVISALKDAEDISYSHIDDIKLRKNIESENIQYIEFRGNDYCIITIQKYYKNMLVR